MERPLVTSNTPKSVPYTVPIYVTPSSNVVQMSLPLKSISRVEVTRYQVRGVTVDGIGRPYTPFCTVQLDGFNSSSRHIQPSRTGVNGPVLLLEQADTTVQDLVEPILLHAGGRDTLGTFRVIIRDILGNLLEHHDATLILKVFQDYDYLPPPVLLANAAIRQNRQG